MTIRIMEKRLILKTGENIQIDYVDGYNYILEITTKDHTVRLNLGTVDLSVLSMMITKSAMGL